MTEKGGDGHDGVVPLQGADGMATSRLRINEVNLPAASRLAATKSKGLSRN